MNQRIFWKKFPKLSNAFFAFLEGKLYVALTDGKRFTKIYDDINNTVNNYNLLWGLLETELSREGCSYVTVYVGNEEKKFKDDLNKTNLRKIKRVSVYYKEPNSSTTEDWMKFYPLDMVMFRQGKIWEFPVPQSSRVRQEFSRNNGRGRGRGRGRGSYRGRGRGRGRYRGRGRGRYGMERGHGSSHRHGGPREGVLHNAFHGARRKREEFQFSTEMRSGSRSLPAISDVMEKKIRQKGRYRDSNKPFVQLIIKLHPKLYTLLSKDEYQKASEGRMSYALKLIGMSINKTFGLHTFNVSIDKKVPLAVAVVSEYHVEQALEKFVGSSEQRLTVIIKQVGEFKCVAKLIGQDEHPGDVFQDLNEQRTVVLLGKTGAGKSSLGNLLLKKEVFGVSAGSISCTKNVQVGKSTEFVVIDTIGIGDTSLTQQEVLHRLSDLTWQVPDGFNCVILVYESRLGPDVLKSFEWILTTLFREKAIEQILVVRTKYENDLKKVETEINNIIQLFSEKAGIPLKSDQVVVINNSERILKDKYYSRKVVVRALRSQRYHGIVQPLGGGELKKKKEAVRDYQDQWIRYDEQEKMKAEQREQEARKKLEEVKQQAAFREQQLLQERERARAEAALYFTEIQEIQRAVKAQTRIQEENARKMREAELEMERKMQVQREAERRKAQRRKAELRRQVEEMERKQKLEHERRLAEDLERASQEAKRKKRKIATGAVVGVGTGVGVGILGTGLLAAGAMGCTIQ